jgi:hypothetical protein
MEIIATGFTFLTVLLALLTFREARQTRQEDHAARDVERLERLASVLDEFGERVVFAGNHDRPDDWAHAGFSQRKLGVVLASLSQDFELPNCREAATVETNARNAKVVYDIAQFCLPEIERAMKAMAR